jgi:Zn-dependent protease with chaperone function
MPITLKCRCKNTFDVPDALAGKSSMCSECGAFLDVPKPGQKPEPDEREEEREAEREKRSPKELKRLVRDAFEGDIDPVRRTVGYRLALGIVAVAMLGLPGFYIGLVAAIALGLLWHVIHFDLFRMINPIVALILYVGGILFGVTLLVFLVKPLLARPSRARRGRPVKLDKEPVLALFITEIARAVHAPEPGRVDVNAEVNAGAGFGTGLTGLFGHNLTLTIGLPLVAGLTARQFAGVVAHELGHFAQGAGMRVSYIVRSVNAWFARIVFQRDSWDEAVDNWGEGSTWAGFIALVIWGCVLATRALLWVFMMIGHILSGFLMRRMEYDADRSQARLAGSKTVAKTLRRVAVLNKAFEEAMEIVEGCWANDRYPDDFATLVVGLADSMSKADRAEVLDDLEEARTGPLDTHPSYSDRVASAEAEDARGVFRLDELPATSLFRDLPTLSAGASLDLYKGKFGGGLQPTLRPTSDFLRGR